MSDYFEKSPTLQRKPLLKDAAYESIKEQILREELAPGAFLSERKLAQALQIGLTPVRHALQRLADEGFLKISPRQGAYVTDMSVDEVLDIYEIRKVLESFVVSKISGRLSRAELDRLKQNLEEQRKACERNEVENTVALDMEFHYLLCKYSGNSEIQRVMQRLRDKVYRIIVRSVRLQPERTAVSVEEHSRILDALTSGNSAVAVEWMEKHMEFGKRFVLLR